MHPTRLSLILGLSIAPAALLVHAGSADKIAAAKKALEPRTPTLAGKVTTPDFLIQLEKQTGNVVVDRRQKKNDDAVHFDLDKASFWQALDRFAELAGCGVTAYGAEGGVALVDAARRSPQVSYQGIVRTALKRVAAARDLESGVSTCTIHLDVAWEPRFQPFYLGVGPVTATYAKGVKQKELTVQLAGSGHQPVAGRNASEVELHLPGPERSSPALESLEGSFKFLGPVKLLMFRIADIKDGAMLEQEEVIVRLVSVKAGLDRWRIEVQIDNPEGTPVLESFQTWLDHNRIALVQGTGTKARTWLPEPNETVLVETNRKAVLQYSFDGAQGKGKPGDWTLVYRTPGRIVEITAPYRFQAVALP